MSNPYYQGPPSDHFDGTRFFHPGLPPSDKTLLDVLRWRLTTKRPAWPDPAPGHTGLQPQPRVDGLQITAIGHSSLLIQVAGANFLLDPVWSEQASPFRWIGPRRHSPPAIRLENLPPIHAIFITHNHYDHLDRATIDRLWKQHRPRILAPLGNDAIIRAITPQAQVETGDWWNDFSLPDGIRVTIVPSYHWSSRGIRDRRMALWGGFVLQTPSGSIYCAGDTAYRDGAIFPQIRARLGSPAVAILPIGAYAPRWFMQTQHASPEEALKIAQDVGARQMLGVHWGTFPLTDEPYDQPKARLQAAVRAESLSETDYLALQPGDTWPPQP